MNALDGYNPQFLARHGGGVPFAFVGSPGRSWRWPVILLGCWFLLIGGWMEATEASPLYRRGCEFPLEGVQVCWEATGDAGSDFSPFQEDLHVLPLSQERGGDVQVLDEYTRSIFRQLLPAEISSSRLVQEWTPVTRLEEALALVKRRGWPLAIWISPRQLRESRAATSGVVDWDGYLIRGSTGKLLRTIRIRVESHPQHRSVQGERAVGSVLLAGAAHAFSWGLAPALVGVAVSTKTSRPDEAGSSLELMTELAARQLLFVFQYPMEELKPPAVGDESPTPVKQIKKLGSLLAFD